jgi:hypothetical protein
VNPKYLGVLFTDPIGRGMMGVAAVIMSIGALVIKKMIHIRVFCLPHDGAHRLGDLLVSRLP